MSTMLAKPHRTENPEQPEGTIAKGVHRADADRGGVKAAARAR